MSGRAAEVEIRREYPDQPGPEEIQRRNVNAIRATIFGLARTRKADRAVSDPAGPGTSSGESRAADVDPWVSYERRGLIVPPPFDLLTLAMMPENNTELGPAIDAMAVNVESFGYRPDPRVTIDESTSLEILETLARERVALENFFESCCPDGESLVDLRDKLRRDIEATGNAYVEFVENPGTKTLSGLVHLPAWTMRISPRDVEVTPYFEPVVEKTVRVRDLGADLEEDADVESVRRRRYREDVSFRVREVLRYKRFRRYVQIIDRSVVWFKELGDPRLISSEDGTVVTRERLVLEDPSGEVVPRFTLVGDRLVLRTGTVGFQASRAANPVRHRRLYSTRSPYGLPRYIGHLFCIFGSRAAEEINFVTFKNNNIPSLAITVSNGKLDDASLERVQEFVEAAIQSDDNYSKFLLLEAEPVMEGMRDPGAMKIDIKPLTREQHTDAMFTQYQKENDDRVRRAWRFPPVFVGVSSDFTGKTIDASRRLADEQVFGPERERVDRFFNRDVLPRLGVVWTKFKSLAANVTENADLVRMLATGEKTGGVTPRIARKLLSRVVNEDLGEIDVDALHPDVPFSLQLAQIMKSSSSSDAVGGGEPTSQGTAGIQVAGPGRDRESEPSHEDLVSDDAEDLDRRGED